MPIRLKRIFSTGDKDFLEVLRYSAWAIIALGTATSTQFIFDLVLARRFGADGSGAFYIAISVLSIAGLLGRVGLDRAVVRFLPSMVMQKKYKNANGLISTASKLTLLISIPISILVFILAPYLSARVFTKPELLPYIRISALAIPAFSLVYVTAGILRALKLVKESFAVERIFIYGLGIIAILTLGIVFGLTGTLWGFIVSIYISLLIGRYLIKKHVPRTKSTIPFNYRLLLGSALPLLFVMFSNQMIGQVNVLVVGALETTSSVGVFNVALKTSMLMGLILTGINAINATKISEFHAKNRNLSLLASKTAALATITAFPLFLAMLIIPKLILGLFGSDFKAGAMVLIVLAIGQLINVFVGSVTYILAMTGHEKALAYTILISLIINVLLSLMLVPVFGILGAGIAVSVSIAIKNVLELYLVRKYLGVWSLPFKAVKLWTKNLL